MIESKNIEYLLFLLFIGIWASIGSDPYNFLYLFEDSGKTAKLIADISLKDFINLLRAIFPYFSLLISLIILIRYKLFFNHSSFVYFLLFIQIIQIISTYFSKNTIVSEFETSIDHIGRYHWIISSLATIFIFMISNKIKNFNKENFFYVSIFFLFFIVIFFSSRIIYDFYDPIINTPIYNINIWRESGYFLNHQIPRVTGLSRSILVILIIILFLRYRLNSFFKYLRYFFLIILGSLIFLFQSKFSVIFIFIIYLFYIFNSKTKIKNFLKILILFSLQILLFFAVTNFKFYIKDIENNKSIQNIDTIKKIEKKKNKYIRDVRDNKGGRAEYIYKTFINKKKYKKEKLDQIVFSGRVKLWSDTVNFVKNRPFLGYGSMSDRILLNKKRLNVFDTINPVSNAYLYAAVSGGIFCLLTLIFFLISTKKIFFNILSFRNDLNFSQQVGTLLFFMLILRSLIENSFMIFGIDFILILNILYILKKR